MKKFFHLLVKNEFVKQHPIWYWLLVVALTLSGMSFIYLMMTGQIGADEILQTSFIFIYLFMLLLLFVLLLSTIINAVRSTLYYIQADRYHLEKSKVEAEIKNLLKDHKNA